jgi:hypothetical protein
MEIVGLEIQTIVGILIVLIAIRTLVKVVKDIAGGLISIVLLMIGATLIFGTPIEIGQVPIIGSVFGSLDQNVSVQDVGIMLKDIAWSVKILGASKDAEGSLVIALANTGQVSFTKIEVFVDDMQVKIANSPKFPIKKGEVRLIDTDYVGEGLKKIKVKAGSAEDEFVVDLG